ncbi:MAG: fused MFS/spermidine synthase [Acidobacteriota bacterium]
MRRPDWRIASLVFGSGLCGLVYQIGWLREFRLIFGASTAASASVLAIFIGGLGAGALLLGPRADRHPRPIRLYAQLEAVVALSAAASPFLLALVRTLYIAAGGTARLGLAGGTAGRLLLSALVLAVPTVAMGGTLPALARGVTRQSDVGRRDVAILYGVNALGAVAGCLIATFYLLEHAGTRGTLWLAAGINLIVALVAARVDGTMTAAAGIPARTSAIATPIAASSHQAPPTFLLIASAVVGFAFFLMELVWYRMLGPLLGGSIFTFSLILAAALAGIGIGGVLYALTPGDRTASLSRFAATCLLEAAALAGVYALGDRLAVLTLTLRPLASLEFGIAVACWTLVTTVVVLPAAIVAGYQFPLLIALFGRGRAGLGRQVGLAYAANTLGAMAGALSGGFGLLPWLGAPGAWRFAAMLLVTLGVSAAALSWHYGGRRPTFASLAVQLAIASLALAGFGTAGPTAVWRHSGIGAGRATATLDSANRFRDWANAQQRAIVWDEDGAESSVALAAEPNGYAFIVNGKSDGSARGDAGTQVMLGLLGAIINPGARRSLVIGLGTGSSAGWLGAVPGMERVDVVELEPLVVDVARACDEVNRDVLRNPKVHLTIGDARETLLTGRERYDLIASEPSNPFRAGVASLFTRDYYAAARERLTDDGVFLQWVQLYEIDARTLATVYATIAAVFPSVEAWQAGGGDLVLVGSKKGLTYRADVLTARIQQEPFKTALSAAWRTVDLTGLLAHFLANDRLARVVADTPGVGINTDDRNVVEFGFARSMGSGASLIAELRQLARTAGHARPAFSDQPAIDWAAVDTAWVGYQATEQHLAGVEVSGPSDEQARQSALLLYYRDSDLAAARSAWQRQTRTAAGPTELAMLSDLGAESGSEDALPLIEQLRQYQPGEADAILATLRFRQGRFEDAAAALEAAFADFRDSPWALHRFKERAVALATAVAIRRPGLAVRMFDGLNSPFAIRALQDERLLTVATLTRLLDFDRQCRDAVAALEPHPPWSRSFLTLRRDCYRAVGDPRRGAAARDLDEFVARDPARLGARQVTGPSK